MRKGNEDNRLLNSSAVSVVIRKLVGPVSPTGETNEDNRRFDNLETLIHIVDRLLFDIDMVRSHKERPEHSVGKIGKRANEFLNSLNDCPDKGEDNGQ